MVLILYFLKLYLNCVFLFILNLCRMFEFIIEGKVFIKYLVFEDEINL